MKRLVNIIWIMLFTIGFSGCAYLSITVNNLGNAIFNTPKEVVTKVKEPVKDDVRLSVLWAGHSSMLVQMFDKVIMFDPYFNNHLGGLFMRRLKTGLDIDNLKSLDLICVSHSHMDHMCFSSIGDLSEKFPKAKLVFPYGVENYMPPFDIDMIRLDNRNVTKNKTGNPILAEGVEITPVYAVHTGGRYALDTYTWKTEGCTGYILQYKGLCIYFAGDTGYDSVAFRKIGSEFKIDLALIPVGPCRNCDSVGFKYHTSSIEALMVFRDLKAKQMIPMHYGAIKYMSDENYPIKVMENLLNTTAYSDLKSKVTILNVGEQVFFNSE
jgi:N-acyl-phosphatidylethanolamine-hydrolysing phospholipase D